MRDQFGLAMSDRNDLTGTVWVDEVSEPITMSTVTWTLNADAGGHLSGLESSFSKGGGAYSTARVIVDPYLRCGELGAASDSNPSYSYSWIYDSANNVISENGLTHRVESTGGKSN